MNELIFQKKIINYKLTLNMIQKYYCDDED